MYEYIKKFLYADSSLSNGLTYYGGGTVKSTIILFAYSLVRKLAASVVSRPN